MQIIDYHERRDKAHWIRNIQHMAWPAAGFLYRLLREERLNEVLGEHSRLFLMVEGERLISFATLTQRDCIEDGSLYPWIGFLYVVPEHRGKQLGRQMLEHACRQAKDLGHAQVYLATDHVGFYEKYGFAFLESRMDIYGESSRIYKKTL